MLNHNQDGAVSGLLISLVLTVLLFLGAAGFGIWAFMGRQDYKNHVSAKVDAAVALAQQKQSTADKERFDQEAKQPLKAYNGPEAYGSMVVQFPKTWSAYVDDTGNGNALVDGYFAPGTVPAIGGQSSVFALRVQVIGQSYATTLKSFAGLQQAGKLTVKAYALPKLPQTVGIEAVGEITGQKSVNMVVMPLRSQTLEIWTEGNSYLNDFNNNILPNFSFSP